MTIEDGMQLRDIDSEIDGHPNPAEGFPFFPAATGSLGQGLSISAGLAAGARLVFMAVLLFVVAPAAGLFGAWVGAMARTASMASESAAAYAIGRRYVGLAAVPERQPPRRASTAAVLPKQSD